MKRIAVMGLGRWGQRLLRVFRSCAEVPICIIRPGSDALSWALQHYPDVTIAFDLDRVLQDETIDAIAIATPVDTHAELVKRVLDARKHVFVEKPLATSADSCEALFQLANSVG